MALYIGGDVLPTISSSFNIGNAGYKWNSFNGIKPVLVASTTSVPAAGNSTTIVINGLTSSHRLVAWNFSVSAENNPPVDLSWTTTSGSCTITNTSGTTSETMAPVFVCPFA